MTDIPKHDELVERLRAEALVSSTFGQEATYAEELMVEAADAIEALAALQQPDERDEQIARAREQGQREGKAAVCQWLRDRSAIRPPATYWSAAAALAEQFEQSEQPGAALGASQ